jgi:hypothetical protein
MNNVRNETNSRSVTSAQITHNYQCPPFAPTNLRRKPSVKGELFGSYMGFCDEYYVVGRDF